jgi:hypothetical protein
VTPPCWPWYSLETLLDILIVLFDECCGSSLRREKTVSEFIDLGECLPCVILRLLFQPFFMTVISESVAYSPIFRIDSWSATDVPVHTYTPDVAIAYSPIFRIDSWSATDVPVHTYTPDVVLPCVTIFLVSSVSGFFAELNTNHVNQPNL